MRAGVRSRTAIERPAAARARRWSASSDASSGPRVPVVEIERHIEWPARAGGRHRVTHRTVRACRCSTSSSVSSGPRVPVLDIGQRIGDPYVPAHPPRAAIIRWFRSRAPRRAPGRASR
ncbi:hypothetical protein WS68_01170 [Burkholderia sp. TSV86]|nr:hypothetical protein WS68_01170 [Burkholderia sp. TSV86]